MRMFHESFIPIFVSKKKKKTEFHSASKMIRIGAKQVWRRTHGWRRSKREEKE